MWCTRAFSALAFTLLMLAKSASGGSMWTVYYIPMDVETYIPVTKETVTQEAFFRIQIQQACEPVRQAKAGRFRSEGGTQAQVNVRLLAEREQEPVIVVYKTGVLQAGDASFWLAEADQKDLSGIMGRLTKGVEPRSGKVVRVAAAPDLCQFLSHAW